MHGTADIAATHMHVAHDAPVAIPMVRNDRDRGATDAARQFTLRSPIAAFASLGRVDSTKANTALPAGQSVAVHRTATRVSLRCGLHRAGRLPPLCLGANGQRNRKNQDKEELSQSQDHSPIQRPW